MKCGAVKPSELKYKAVLLRKTAGASDGLGGFESNFLVLGTYRAKVVFGGLSDKVTGAFLGFASSAAMTVRANVPIQLADRVTVGGRQYTVTGADPVEPGARYRAVYLRLSEHEVA